MTITAPPSFLQSKIGGFPRPFWVLFGGTIVNRLGTMVEPFFGIYLTQSRGMSLAVTGLVLSVFGAGSLLSQPLAGWLADRVGRRGTLTGGMFASAATMLALGYSTSVQGIVAGMFVLGVVVDAYRPASQALVADLVSPEDRPRAFGLLFWGLNLGFSIAMITGGRLAEAGFLWLFWINAITCVLFGILVWRAIPETRPAVTASSGGFREVFADRLMLAFVAVNLAYTCVYLQAFYTLPLAMAGLGTSAYGWAMAVNGLLIVFVQPLTNNWLARRDHSVVLAAGFVIVGVGFALTVFASTALGFSLTIAVWTLGEILTAGMGGAIVAALSPPHLRGRYSGLYGFSWSVGALITPLLGTRLLAISPAVLWLSVGALGLVAALGQLALAPAIRRRARLVVGP
ncbi:MFS transporter [Acrocarpospora corrugata]|uniref:MFS transporter n=1 Tax=Acrocarpospora corrugata TaxID=35763 RepID=A0A5M3W530_9ACTN|nr:MFS transporter [Acrocarpospora corrugata]GES03856.1 MFS transporter [Acrocarpospora corrugata]